MHAKQSLEILLDIYIFPRYLYLLKIVKIQLLIEFIGTNNVGRPSKIQILLQEIKHVI